MSDYSLESHRSALYDLAMKRTHECEALRAEVDRLRARVAELEAAAGRPLTAQDVRDAHHASFGVPSGDEFREFVADYLNGVARGEGSE